MANDANVFPKTKLIGRVTPVGMLKIAVKSKSEVNVGCHAIISLSGSIVA